MCRFMKNRMQLALYWLDKADESFNSATSELDAGRLTFGSKSAILCHVLCSQCPICSKKSELWETLSGKDRLAQGDYKTRSYR